MAVRESESNPVEPYLTNIIRVIEEMRQAGVIGDYVVGGSVAVIFHTDPFYTDDMDIFAALPETRGGIVTLGPVYEYLRNRGYEIKQEHVILGGFPVQILPTGGALEEEAFREAMEFEIGPYRVKVLRPEHLLAIYTRLRRPKDWPKIDLLVHRAHLDEARFKDIVGRHRLEPDWKKVQDLLNEYRQRARD